MNNSGAHLQSCIDDATKLELAYRLGLYEDVGAAHKPRLPIPYYDLLINYATTLLMPLEIHFDAT